MNLQHLHRPSPLFLLPLSLHTVQELSSPVLVLLVKESHKANATDHWMGLAQESWWKKLAEIKLETAV